MYGMTETATAFTCGDATDSLASRLQGHGTPLPGNLLRLVEPGTDNPVASGREGEICVSGPNLMEGYTDGSHQDRIDDLGFFHTGDIGRLDDLDRLHFTGRTSSLIKNKGLTVQPEEVESVLLAMPGVLHAVAVGVRDGVDSAGVHALVALQPTAVVSSAELHDHCKARLSSYKVPSIRTIDPSEFPLTASMKVDRRRASDLVNGRGTD
jgi:fatty-acyl-CoA synthase